MSKRAPGLGPPGNPFQQPPPRPAPPPVRPPPPRDGALARASPVTARRAGSTNAKGSPNVRATGSPSVRPKAAAAAPPQSQATAAGRTVVIERRSTAIPLGLDLKSKPTRSNRGTLLTVAAIAPTGAVAGATRASNRIDPGDRIVSINGRDLRNVPVHASVKLLNHAKLVLVVAPDLGK